MSVTRLFTAFVTSTLLLMASGTASAQSNSLFGSSGPLATTGTGLSNGGGGRTGTTGLGSGGVGQGTTGGNALGTQAGQAQIGQLSNTIGSGFVGRGDNAGRLIGQQNASQQGGNTNRTFQGVNNNTARNANQNFNAQGNTQNTIRPVVRVAFRHRLRTTAVLNTTVRTRFRRLAVRQPRFRGVTVAMVEGRNIVLRGTVDSDASKVLAENIARMEPGIRSVRNELVVKK